MRDTHNLFPKPKDLTNSSNHVGGASRWLGKTMSISWETFRSAIKRFDEYLNSWDWRRDSVGVAEVKNGGEEEDEEWDWERWRKHFTEVDEQERIVSVLKSQLAGAIDREDYGDAARLKVAIAAAATNDTVGRVMSHLKKAVDEERYGDAALVRDYAGAGLVGWWAGISEDTNDPYGRIIHITAEHGRYVARSYSPRQLATASDGAPLFEIFLTRNNKGEYKQQAVYLKRRGAPQNLSIPSFMSSGSTGNLDSQDATENKNELFDKNAENTEDGDDRDDDSGFENVLRDMIPGVKVKVVQVTTPIKMDRDLISKAIERIIDEEEEEKDFDLENVDTEDEIKGETDDEQNEIDLDAGNGISDGEEQSQIAVKVVMGGGLIQKFSSGAHHKDLVRVPARLRKKGRLSFTFTVEEVDDKHIPSGDGQSPSNKNAKLLGRRSMDLVMLDLVKSISKGKIPMKVLKDVGELINLTISQARNRQPLYGSTTFNRIEISASPDPLNGLYIGAHGLYTSEVIHLRRRFGQWKDDGSSNKPSKVEFYEYVEAVKLTGDPYVPAGQIAFRAKVGKRYQLPHKGIIPEEFGVVARYRGQGRLAEPGFQNPRWVDGELVILDGKYIKGGPVVGFVYWAPEYHFLVVILCPLLGSLGGICYREILLGEEQPRS
ncbi:Protein EXECUTER 1 [Forsythia ovata]|uniref:Protein EXECUTER 1 n=1 Tax=Forsythia ovata TaxID=205694 RepID=A0ABD1VIN7_9LAMI